MMRIASLPTVLKHVLSVCFVKSFDCFAAFLKANWRRPVNSPFLECAAQLGNKVLGAGRYVFLSSVRHNIILWKNPYIQFMKQELPFAVALLATGCLLWLAQSSPDRPEVSGGNMQVSEHFHPDSEARSSVTDSIEPRQQAAASFHTEGDGISRSRPLELVGYQEELKEEKKPARAGNHFVEQARKNHQLRPYVHAVSNSQSVRLLTETSRQLSATKPFGSSIRLTGSMFGRVVSATGNYFQMGQGTGKSRMEMKFGSGPDAPTVFQLCDGRFVYKLQIEGSEQSFEFIDLHKVKNTTGEQLQNAMPTGWVASGGIASLFQQLALTFNFGNIETIDETSIALRGSWEESAFRRITTEPALPPKPKVDWNQAPAQIPHGVKIVLRKHEVGVIDSNNADRASYFPQQITFLRFETDDSGQLVPTPTVVLEMSTPQALSKISDRFFVIDSPDLESVDISEQYIARIKQFKQTLQAEAATETLER